MDATLNIIVRVAAKQAIQQLNATSGAVGAVAASSNRGFGAVAKNISNYTKQLYKANLAQANFAANLASSKLINHGKNLNWVGRQLIYNFTLPLVLAGAALFKFNKDIEKSMVQVKKVYGDLSFSNERVKKETDLLSKSFELLSSRFGVIQTDVIDIAAAFASAGSAGRGLAENTKAALQLMILGEMESVAATEALIAVQAQWRLSTFEANGATSELTKTLAVLNIIENETAATMEDLITSMAKSSGVARSAGVTVRELAAMTAALVPAAGNATEAGNSLKTIISRMMAPTKAMTDILSEMGIVVSDPDWLGATATERLSEIAFAFKDLSTAQQAQAASVLAGRRQVSRFSILMEEMANTQGFYAKALEASSDEARNLATFQKELNTVLESNPRKWDIMTNSIRNTMASAFIPLMPAIMSLVGLIAQLAQAFSELNPETQRIILFSLAVVAVVGPLMSLAGSLMQLVGVFHVFIKAIGGVAGLLLNTFQLIGKGFVMLVVKPMVGGLMALNLSFTASLWIVVGVLAAVAAAIALILFTDIEDPFIRVFQSIVRGISALPRIFAQAFQSLVRVIQRAVEIAVEWLSYLNPFQRHSPSLVDNVKAGVATIISEYDKLKNIPETVARALASLSAFKTASSGDVTGFRSAELNDMAGQVAAQNPAAGAAAYDMVDDIMALEALLPGLSVEIEKQRIEVSKLTFAYDQADAAVEQAEAALDSIRQQMEETSDAMAEAQGKIDKLANTKISGMTAMEDAIFANSMAQKKLNLELLKYEQAGYSIDKVRDSMATLAGDIEMLRGEHADLRLKGAGSDVLSVYEDEIKALEAQKGPLEGIAGEIQSIQDQLDALDIEGQIMELMYSITFDPMLREIDKLVNGVEEMSFDDIVAGIIEQQGIIEGLQRAYEDLEKAEKAAKEVVDSTTSERDKIGAALDSEKEKLDALEEAYSSIKTLIGEMESAMADYVQMATAAAEIDAAKKAGGDDSLFAAAAAGDYEISGGDSVLGAEGDAFDIEAFNKEMEAELQKALEGMGNIDIAGVWGNLKEKIIGWWNGIVEWVKNNWVRLLGAAVVGVVALVFGAPALLAAALAGLGYLFVSLTRPVWDWTWEHIIGPIVDALSSIGTFLMENVIGPIMDFFGVLGGIISGVWNAVIFPVLEGMWGAFLTLNDIVIEVMEAIWGIIEWAWGLVVGVFDAIVDYINNYLVPVFEFFQVTALIVWELVSLAIQAAGDLIVWVFENWIEPAIDGLANQFGWLWERIDEIFGWVNGVVMWLWHNVFEPAFDGIVLAVGEAWNGIHGIIDQLGGWLETAGGYLTGFYDTLIRPVLGAIGLAFATVWNGVISATQTAINFFINAFNLIARGVNAVASLLNIDARVTEMATVSFDAIKFDTGMFAASDSMVHGTTGGGGGGNVRVMASGGILGAMGGAVKEARAIVGEGSDIHPEYVIPTDPKYRDRAKGLYNQLGETLGMGDDGFSHMDLFGDIGGAISSGFNTAKNAVGAVGGAIKEGALTLAWQPLKALANAAVGLIPVKFIKDIGKSMIGAVDNWVTGAGNAWNQEAVSRVPVAEGKPGGWMAILQMLARQGIPHRFLSGYRPGAITRNTGQPSWHGKNRAVDVGSLAGTFPSSYSPSQLLAINHAIYDAYKPQLQEMIYGGPGAKNVFRGRDHTFSRELMNEHINHVHAALARGGFVVPRTAGGSLFRMGEGLYDEAVQVTPLHGQGADGQGDTTNNFYGELVFPNIKTGDDAEAFLRNLEVLSK
jgi:TP901 family phage tail tape measure protein